MNASARSVPSAPPDLPPASASTHAVLSYAVEVAKRAPSAHNTQPWAPRVLEHSIDLGVTPARTLPAADPTSRDLLLALGAWVECVAIAANARGHRIEVERLPDLDRLEELPVTGEADVARPVLRISLASPDRALPELLPDRPLPDGAANVPFSRFTPQDVAQRATFRGELARHESVFSTIEDPAAQIDLPPWLSLREVDSIAMRRLRQLGTWFTFARPEVTLELIRWLRFTPRTPDYTRDG